MSKRKSQAGFTLLEVVVAMVILGIGLSVVFQLLAQSKRISVKSDRTVEAARIMANLVNDPLVMEDAEERMEISGAVPGETGWNYRIRVTSPVTIPGEEGEEPYENESLGKFEITLTDVAGSRERSFSTTRWRVLGSKKK